MIWTLLVCQGEKTNTTYTHTQLDTYKKIMDAAEESTDTGSTTESEETTTYQRSVEQGHGAGTYEDGVNP